MRKFLTSASILGLLLCVAPAAFGQAANGGARPAAAKPAPAAPAAKANSVYAILPAADLLATVDTGRLMNELLPKLASLSVGGIDKMAQELADFTKKTGIDPTRVPQATIAMQLSGAQAQAVILLQGLDLDPKSVEAAMAAFKTEYKAGDYKGRAVYDIVAKVKAPTAGPLSVKTDQMSLAALGSQLMAFGDRAMIQKVIDIQTGADKNVLNPAMIAALDETRANALVRFALNIPADLRSQAVDQGDLFKSVATIKMILGTFDVASDFALSLDTLMRTASPADAGELENGLKGLVSLIRGIFGGGNDPATDFIGQLLDQIKIGSKQNDVTLSISLSKSILDQIMKKAVPAEKK